MTSLIRTAQNIPVIGPWARKVGSVIKLMATPCSISPQIWVEAFFVGEAQLIYSFVKPQPLLDRILKGSPIMNRLVEGGGASEPSPPPGGHGGLGGGGFGFLPGGGKPPFPGAVIIFEIGELILHLQWWFFVIDAGIDLAVNWSSLAYEWAGCLGDPGDYCDLGSAGPWPVGPGTEWTRTVFSFVGGNPIYDGIDGILVPRNGDGGGGVACSFEPFPFAPEPVGSPEIRIRRLPSGEILKQFQPGPYRPGGNNTVGGLFDFGRSGGSGFDKIVLEARGGAGGWSQLTAQTGHMHVGGSATRGVLPAFWGKGFPIESHG